MSVSVGGLVLAAGKSTRFGENNKLLACWREEPLVVHALRMLVDAGIDTRIVVTGHDAQAVRTALDEALLERSDVHASRYDGGQAMTLAAGIDAMAASDVDAVIVCLGDMPSVPADLLVRLVAAFSQTRSADYVVPVHAGRRGNPVLIARSQFAAVSDLSGDAGARQLMRRRGVSTRLLDINCKSILTDVDTPAALALLKNASEAGAIQS